MDSLNSFAIKSNQKFKLSFEREIYSAMKVFLRFAVMISFEELKAMSEYVRFRLPQIITAYF